MNSIEPRKDLLERIRTVGFHTADKERIISPHGRLQSWIIDLRQVFLHQPSLQSFARLFWQTYAQHEAFQLGTIETAAIPLLTAVLLHAPETHREINAFILRKERKRTGLGRVIEGRVNSLPIVIIDDLLNSGSSLEKAYMTLQEYGHSVSDVFVVMDYRSATGLRWRANRNITVSTLFTLSDLGLILQTNLASPSQQYRLLWQRSVAGGFPYHVVPKSGPVLVDGVLYRGSDAGFMQAFSAATGEVLWSFEATGSAQTKGIWSTPALHQNKLYFGAYNGNVYCLNSNTGEEIWVQTAAEWVGASPLLLPKYGLLYIGLEYERPWAQGSVCALNMQTGEKVWENFTHKFQHGSAAYWAAGGLVIWGTADHQVSAFNPQTGQVIWTFATERSVKYAPAVDEERGLVAFASFDKHIYLLDAASGQLLQAWQTGDLCYTTPLFARGKLFCGSGDKRLYVIDLATLRLLEAKELGARVYSSPRLVAGRVVVGTSGGRVMEIDPDSLETVGSLQLPDAVTNAVAHSPDGRLLYISTYMNSLYAFERLL